MFAGYVFVRCGMDKRSYIEIVKIRGVVRLLGEAWDRLAPIPDDEIATIRRVVETDTPVFPYPYLRDGQQVRITDGPLKGVEGVLVQSKPRKGLLVVSVSLLQRSIAVEVEGTDVVPASTICRSHASGWDRAALAAQGLRASEA
jgi:transcription antitermination factor NusG